ncbi:Pycsar system effector family protein [Nonomuraea wenchangensis]
MTPEEKAFAAHLLTETREELARADNKASILLGITGLVGGVLLSSTLAADWSPSRLGFAAQVVWWVSTVAGFTAVALLVSAVIPVTKRPSGPSEEPMYFGDVVHFSSNEQLVAALKSAAVSSSTRVVDQLMTVSRIVSKKYRLIRSAAIAIGICFAGYLVCTLLP